MTVKELIDQLSALPADKEVWIGRSGLSKPNFIGVKMINDNPNCSTEKVVPDEHWPSFFEYQLSGDITLQYSPEYSLLRQSPFKRNPLMRSRLDDKPSYEAVVIQID